jgi:hypothetical protein
MHTIYAALIDPITILIQNSKEDNRMKMLLTKAKIKICDESIEYISKVSFIIIISITNLGQGGPFRSQLSYRLGVS